MKYTAINLLKNNKTSTLYLRYLRLIIHSYFPFLLYIFAGIVLFVSLTLSTRVNIVKTFHATLTAAGQNVFVVFSGADAIKSSELYLYSDKNDATYSATAEHIKNVPRNYIDIHFEKSSDAFVNTNIGKMIYIDVPVKSSSLFERIFKNGGKNE